MQVNRILHSRITKNNAISNANDKNTFAFGFKRWSWNFLYPIGNIWKQHFIHPKLDEHSLSVKFWMVYNWSWYFSWQLLGRVANHWNYNDPIYPCRSSTAESLKPMQSKIPVNKQPCKWHLTTKIPRQTAKFPDNSLTFQSKQNTLTFPDFPESENHYHYCSNLL